MALFIATGHGGCSGGRIICTNPTKHHPYTHHRPQIVFPLAPRRAHHIIVSAKKLPSSARTGRFDSKNKRSSITTKDQDDNTDDNEEVNADISSSSSVDVEDNYYDILSKLPKDETEFWEGPQWDALGFFLQYLWAFGIVFALIACGIAVATYNEGATDFKDTPAYKESVQSQELLEEPDASTSDVFESNPTEIAPSLD
ncbi:uncharacterized protein LOC8268651 [Ricinus communis]|uniref:Uncharacterized protein n=1 Tax=Ricinus communis TaxID=3988 RepID=B9T329_RICCO|nr:uncharacterized protein LOC8268651 [Ricinus communis]EEF29721.1 conserved hypothetical protein [Ricinus communis]|eukprot:XP_002532648.1 uncharacterized protein LOC8268651 [Ricinus communis]